MNLQRIRPRALELRPYIVVAALISLCVSSNVGPRFLPLPALSDLLVINQSEQKAETASRPAVSDSYRVPMMAQTQKRADREPQPPQPFALVLKGSVSDANEIRLTAELKGGDFLLEHPPFSLVPGRAPPV